MHTDVTFILADNQDITRAGMYHFLSAFFGACPTKEVSGKKELMCVLAEGGDGVVVLDYTLFDLNGVDEFFILVRRFPRVQWLMFSDELSEAFIRRLSIERNISILLKDASAEEVRQALLSGIQARQYFCHQVESLLATVSDKPEIQSVLTGTEIEILKQIVHGKSAKEVAAERNSSVHTIITHKKNIFRKLGVNNIYEATKYAIRAGLVEMVEYYI